jgi:hypothetical protein
VRTGYPKTSDYPSVANGCAYTGLIEMACALGKTDAVSLLGQRLKEEKELVARWNR